MSASGSIFPRGIDSGIFLGLNIYVIEAFLNMRSLLAEHHGLARQVADLEKKLAERLDVHEVAIVDLLRRIMKLLAPPPMPDLKRRRIGFNPAE